MDDKAVEFDNLMYGLMLRSWKALEYMLPGYELSMLEIQKLMFFFARDGRAASTQLCKRKIWSVCK
jgi:hypothetical protein